MEPNELDSQENSRKPVQYATPMQRLWAWVGVAYMVILILLTTYALAHGAYLKGIGGIMLSPALCGLGGTVILRYRQGLGRGGLPVCILLSGSGFALAVWNVIRDIPVLLGQL